MALSDKELRNHINGTYRGKYTVGNLPYAVFKNTAQELTEAFETGWGNDPLSNPDIYAADLAKFNSFRNNLFYFAGVKTSAYQSELNDLLHDADGNRRTLVDFTAEALKLDKTFNQNYLATEYDITHKVAHNAHEWKAIEETKDIFPILEWVTVMDANTRHEKFNGIKLPADDPFWASHPQPLEYGCRCRKRQHRDAEVTKHSDLSDLPAPPDRPWYGKPWGVARVWDVVKHPYSDGLKGEAVAGVAKLMAEAIDKMPLAVRTLPNGKRISEHPHHVLSDSAEDVAELKRNRESADTIAWHGHDVKLLPNYDGVDGRTSPDVEIDNGLVGDFKRASRRHIIDRINSAFKQGARVAIIQMDHSSITAKDAANRVMGGFKSRSIDDGILEVWFIINGRVIKADRKTKGLVETLIKAESAEPLQHLRFRGHPSLSARI